MKNLYVYILALMITIIILASFLCTYKKINNPSLETDHCNDEQFWKELVTLEKVM